MKEHYITLAIVLIFASIFIVESFEMCVPVTPFTYDLVKTAPITKYCVCQVADPMGADEKSRQLL